MHEVVLGEQHLGDHDSVSAQRFRVPAQESALTNRGGATIADVIVLARTVRDGVRAAFGMELTPEPDLIGCNL